MIHTSRNFTSFECSSRKISEYNSILADSEKVYGIIVDETEYVKQHYGIKRRTVIESYMFAPGLSHAKYADYRVVRAELAILNVGILLFLASEIAGLKVAALAGAVIIFAGMLVHVYNMSYMFSKKGKVQRQQP